MADEVVDSEAQKRHAVTAPKLGEKPGGDNGGPDKLRPDGDGGPDKTMAAQPTALTTDSLERGDNGGPD